MLVPGRPPGLTGPCPDRGEGGGRAPAAAPAGAATDKTRVHGSQSVVAGAAAAGASPLYRALRSPGFRRFLAARTISQWGDTFNAVAIVILVYQLTSSG